MTLSWSQGFPMAMTLIAPPPGRGPLRTGASAASCPSAPNALITPHPACIPARDGWELLVVRVSRRALARRCGRTVKPLRSTRSTTEISKMPAASGPSCRALTGHASARPHRRGLIRLGRAARRGLMSAGWRISLRGAKRARALAHRKRRIPAEIICVAGVGHGGRRQQLPDTGD